MNRDSVLHKYLQRELRLAKNKQIAKGGDYNKTVVERLTKSIELNEQSLHNTSTHLAGFLASLGRLLDLNKQHHLAVALYKEAIVGYRQIRMSIIFKFRNQAELYKAQVATSAAAHSKGTQNQTDADAEAEDEEDQGDGSSNGKTTEEQGATSSDEDDEADIITNQPEREFALKIAETMRLLSQSLFDEGIKQMGGRRANGVALPDFQYRHSMYVMNRAIEIYHRYIVCSFMYL